MRCRVTRASDGNPAVKIGGTPPLNSVSKRREAYARYALKKTSAGCEEYATARKRKAKGMVEKKGIWKNLMFRTNENFHVRDDADVGRGEKGYCANK